MGKTWGEESFKNKYLNTNDDNQMYSNLRRQKIQENMKKLQERFKELNELKSATTLQATIRRRTAQNIKRRRFRFSILDESPKRPSPPKSQSLPTQLQPKQRPSPPKRQSLPTHLNQRPSLPTINEKRIRLCRNCNQVITGRKLYCDNFCKLAYVLKKSPPSRLSPTSSTKSSSSKSSKSPKMPKKVAK